MDENAYWAVCRDVDRAGARVLPTSFLRISGRDRLSFLQGQISNDVLSLATGSTVSACLLNNTGHLLALLRVTAFDDHLLISADASRVDTVRTTLERFVVRERVEIEAADLLLITLLGNASADSLQKLGVDTSVVSATTHPRLTALAGYDIIVDRQHSESLWNRMKEMPNIDELDDESYETLRVDSGEPGWGNELDETIIPLEAGLENAISFTKGCYMGQEIIARIHSRGHTNRSLVGLNLDNPVNAGTSLVAIEGERAGQEIGRVTSTADSPRFGIIALGYVRNEFGIGSQLKTAVGTAHVTKANRTDGC